MFKILKKFFNNPDEESINIFTEETKIDYDPNIFLSLEVLSITESQLSNLKPLSVFLNLKILNLSGNQIEEIGHLKKLKKIEILDLRFNKIKELPSWIFELDKTLYWERVNEEQKGIYLEGNPLPKILISKIKKYPIELLPNSSKSETLVSNKSRLKPSVPNVALLKPLQRQLVTLFAPEALLSNFLESFTHSQNQTTEKSQFKLNISIVKYNNNYEILNSNKESLKELKYIILILKETQCCLNPPILELLSNMYLKSKIFLVIENSDNRDIEEKITFFKTYNKSLNIIDVYHSFDNKSNSLIKDKIYSYLNNTQEVNSLWKEEWIALRDEIEEGDYRNMNQQTFQDLAEKHRLSLEVREDIFNYLKLVGSIV